ncbi:MAG: 2-dehydropantoate 2-reductase [Thermoplasmata archaeon]
MRLLVVGAGAIGSLFGAKLLVSGQDVTFVARGAHGEAMRQGGLRIEGDGEEVSHPRVVVAIPPGTRTDGILLCVKTFDLATASEMIGRALVGPVPILALQNGLNIDPVVIQALRGSGWDQAENWVVRAVNSVPSMWVAPGRVRQTGTGEVLLPAPSHGGAAAHSDLFRSALEGAGISVRLVDSIDREVWRKAVLNAAINPLTAAHGLANVELLNGRWKVEAQTLLREAQLAAHLAGFDFEDTELDADLRRVLQATAANRSSMVQDLERGRLTEIDAISGAIVRIALAHGTRLPATERMISLVRQKTGGATSPKSH